MNSYPIKQLHFARKSTINYIKDINESKLEIIPLGLNNNIKWNLGHMYTVMDKFCFHLIGENSRIPDNFDQLFAPGTSPKEWRINTPKKDELTHLLSEQISKVDSLLYGRMDEKIEQPYTTSTGLELRSVGELISFCLYHEGMHFGAIKNITSLIDNIKPKK
ncbi:DinB family protein [Virgibacillus salarius]|uniref:DinB family protein n=1 Tax=Virgibacillus salarius TaxID=447199 RepID=UPI0031D76680